MRYPDPSAASVYRTTAPRPDSMTKRTACRPGIGPGVLYFLQAFAAEHCHAPAVIFAALLNIVLIHFQFGHGYGKEIIFHPVENMLLAEGDQLMERTFGAFRISKCVKGKPLPVDIVGRLVIVIPDGLRFLRAFRSPA